MELNRNVIGEAVEHYGEVNLCIGACFGLHCKLVRAAPANLCTKPIVSDPIVVTVDENMGRQRW